MPGSGVGVLSAMKTERSKINGLGRPSTSKSRSRTASHRTPLTLVPKRPPQKRRRLSRRTALILYAALLGAAAIVIALLYAAAPVHADTPPPSPDPMSTVKRVMDQTIAVFKEKDIPATDRRAKLRTIAEAHFDFDGMARSTVGYHWRTLTDDQRKEFVPLFTTFIEDVALTQIEQYSVQRVQHDIQSSVIVFDREHVDGDHAEVFSTVTLQSRPEPLQVSYLMKDVDGDWKIYDIDVDAISVIANYRNQFNRVLNDQGYDRLASLLRQKSQQLGSSLAN
jgi:phospholipid transport system substrate-binding protein